jgi:SHS2 domain-containing protein
MTVEELSHTADVILRVRAHDIPELFSEAARGMFRVMYGECSGATRTKELTLQANDLDDLLHDFLSELLYLSDVKETVYCSFQVRVEGTTLTAALSGVPFNRSVHQGSEIKGISYSGLHIVEEGENYRTDILFDV